MDFSLLGPVEVGLGGRILPLSGSKPRAVLAALLLEANSVLSQDRLVSLVWGDHPPRTAENSGVPHGIATSMPWWNP